MHPHAELVTSFYQAFARRDAAAMGRCYHREVVFSDPVFPRLAGDAARAMWTMLCDRGKDLRIEFRDVEADAARGSAHWEAWYTFSATGHAVHNRIDAAFAFRDGLIAEHTDRFSLTRWAAQALGPKGRLLGWAPPVHAAIRAQAARGLAQWQAKHGSGH